MNIDEQWGLLLERIRALGSAAVAFSGGVDSALLCRAARDALGDRAIAVTIVSPMLPRSEIEDARSLASLVGIRHVLVEEPDIDPSVAENPPHRCYLCKRTEFSAIIDAARREGVDHVLDGSNADDTKDYRPGLKALGELGVVSPLRDAGIDKATIRELSRRLGLPTWDKPAFACLASRVPYGERITAEKLGRIERAEGWLRGIGLRQVRVRCHGDIARIEVGRDERVKLLDIGVMDETSARLKSLGFLYVCMELDGYATGSMNRQIRIGEDARHG
ncbi:MAG TPA: ATP-dependent sacrificial sulfur transferase LarE [Spirochaetia bacterium]